MVLGEHERVLNGGEKSLMFLKINLAFVKNDVILCGVVGLIPNDVR